MLQVLISNAAVLLDSFEERLQDFDPERFLKTISTNTLGPALVLRELLKHVSTFEHCAVSAHAYST
jgi:NAD(P)-dependent dehydrogenase (short-subunit alcohol dehydrogenase family)